MRKAVIAVGALYVAVALVLLFVLGVSAVLVAYPSVTGLIIIASILFERHRYRPRVRNHQRWQTTGERFVDPATGRMVEVFYDSPSGERSYVQSADDQDDRSARS